MCLTCGCMEPENRHGDSRNITRSDLLAATKTEAAGGVSMTTAIKTLNKTTAADRAKNEDLYDRKNAVAKP